MNEIPEMNDLNTSVSFFKDEIKNFVNKRDWIRYHTPKNLVQAIHCEAGELSRLACSDHGRRTAGRGGDRQGGKRPGDRQGDQQVRRRHRHDAKRRGRAGVRLHRHVHRARDVGRHRRRGADTLHVHDGTPQRVRDREGDRRPQSRHLRHGGDGLPGTRISTTR